MKKRQTNRSDTNANEPRSDETNFEAWENNPQAQALRVDLQNGSFFVLPYSHFALAHFDRDENGESLRIAFTTHEVRVSGRHLRELGIALQKLAVEWIREVPPRYAALAEKGRAFIERIEVAEIEDEENAPSV